MANDEPDRRTHHQHLTLEDQPGVTRSEPARPKHGGPQIRAAIGRSWPGTRRPGSAGAARSCPARCRGRPAPHDLRDRGRAGVDVEPQPALVARLELAHVGQPLSTSAACGGEPLRPTVTTSPEISRLSWSGVPSATICTVVDDRDPVAQRVGLVEVVGREEHGHALGAQPAHLVPHVGAALRVQAGGRLVQEQDLRVVDDAQRDVHPPALTAGVGLAPCGRRTRRARRPPARRSARRCASALREPCIRACSTSSSRALTSSPVPPPWAT